MSDLHRMVTQKWPRVLRHHLKTFLGTRPALYFPLFKRREGYEGLLASEHTDICIEGFPRSANSFAVGAFEEAQSCDIQIAHHTHVAANAIRACDQGIPTIVLIRDPGDAVVSNIALTYEASLVQGGSLPKPKQVSGFGRQLGAWQAFYSALDSYEGQFVTAPFEQVIKDFGAVIRTLNTQFDTKFDIFKHTKKAVDTVHTRQGYHAGPNQRRGQIKDRVRMAFEEMLEDDTGLRRALEYARETRAAYLAQPTVAGHSSTEQ